MDTDAIFGEDYDEVVVTAMEPEQVEEPSKSGRKRKAKKIAVLRNPPAPLQDTDVPMIRLYHYFEVESLLHELKDKSSKKVVKRHLKHLLRASYDQFQVQAVAYAENRAQLEALYRQKQLCEQMKLVPLIPPLIPPSSQHSKKQHRLLRGAVPVMESDDRTVLLPPRGKLTAKMIKNAQNKSSPCRYLAWNGIGPETRQTAATMVPVRAEEMRPMKQPRIVAAVAKPPSVLLPVSDTEHDSEEDDEEDEEVGFPKSQKGDAVYSQLKRLSQAK
jgi:hypothetical protein